MNLAFIHRIPTSLLAGAAIVVILAGASAIASAQTAQPEGGAVVSVKAPPSSSVGGGDITVEIDVANVKNLGGFQFVLTVDSNVLEPVSAVKDTFLGSSTREVFCPDPTIASDSVLLKCVTLRDRPAGPDGGGSLALVTLKPHGSGTSNLALSHVRLVEPDGTDIPSTTTDATLRIGAGSSWHSGTRLLIIIGAGIAVLAVVAAMIALAARRRSSSPSL